MKKTNKTQRVKQLATQLDSIIYEAVRGNSDNTYKDLFTELSEEISRQHRTAQDLVEDYKKADLCFNAVEAEGYLRAMTTLKNFLEEINSQKQ